MIYKSIHFILATAIYFSSIGYTLNSHYCKDELINTAIFFKAEPCHKSIVDFDKLGIDISKLQPCCIKALQEEHKSKCCEDVTEYSKVDIENSCIDYAFESNVDIAKYLPLHTHTFILSSHKNIGFNPFYKPPNLNRNFSILFQVFLI
jgi:hypothetical protein